MAHLEHPTPLERRCHCPIVTSADVACFVGCRGATVLVALGDVQGRRKMDEKVVTQAIEAAAAAGAGRIVLATPLTGGGGGGLFGYEWSTAIELRCDTKRRPSRAHTADNVLRKHGRLPIVDIKGFHWIYLMPEHELTAESSPHSGLFGGAPSSSGGTGELRLSRTEQQVGCCTRRLVDSQCLLEDHVLCEVRIRHVWR